MLIYMADLFLYIYLSYLVYINIFILYVRLHVQFIYKIYILFIYIVDGLCILNFKYLSMCDAFNYILRDIMEFELKLYIFVHMHA